MRDQYKVEESSSFEKPANASKLNHLTRERPKFNRRSLKEKKIQFIGKQRSFSTGEFVPPSPTLRSPPPPVSPRPKPVHSDRKIKVLPSVPVAKKSKSCKLPPISPKPQRKKQGDIFKQDNAHCTQSGNKSPPIVSPKRKSSPIVSPKRKSPPIVSPKPVRRKPHKEDNLNITKPIQSVRDIKQNEPSTDDVKLEIKEECDNSSSKEDAQNKVNGDEKDNNEEDLRFNQEIKCVRFQEPCEDSLLIEPEQYKRVKKTKSESISNSFRKGMSKFGDSVASVASSATRRKQRKSSEDNTSLIDPDEDTDRMLKEKEEKKQKEIKKEENNGQTKEVKEKRKISTVKLTLASAFKRDDENMPTKFKGIGYSPRPKRRVLMERTDSDEDEHMETDAHAHLLPKDANVEQSEAENINMDVCDHIEGAKIEKLTLADTDACTSSENDVISPKEYVQDTNKKSTKQSQQIIAHESKSTNEKPTLQVIQIKTPNQGSNVQPTASTPSMQSMSTLNETPNGVSTQSTSTLNETVPSTSTLNETVPSTQYTSSLDVTPKVHYDLTEIQTRNKTPKVRSIHKISPNQPKYASTEQSRPNTRAVQNQPKYASEQKKQNTRAEHNQPTYVSTEQSRPNTRSAQNTSFVSRDDSCTQPTIRKSYSIVTYTPKPVRRNLDENGYIMDKKGCAQNSILRSLSLSMRFDSKPKNNDETSVDEEKKKRRRHTFSATPRTSKKSDRVNLINNSLNEEDSDEDTMLNKRLENKFSERTYQENGYTEPDNKSDRSKIKRSFRSTKRYSFDK